MEQMATEHNDSEGNNFHVISLKNEEESVTESEVVDLAGDDEVLGPQEEKGSCLLGYCRICACAYERMISIYDDSGVEMQLEEKINNYLPITVTNHDKLPLQLCQTCVDKLNVTHDLIISCLDSDSKFKCMEARSNLEDDNSSVVKRKVVVMKLVNSNGVQLPVSVQVAKALQYLKEKKVGEATIETEKESRHNASVEISGEGASSQKCAGNEQTSSPSSDLDNLKVAAVAEFCIIMSGKDKPHDSTTESQKLKSKLCETLGPVGKGMNRKLMEAVQNIVHSSKKSLCCQVLNGTHSEDKVFSEKEFANSLPFKKNREIARYGNLSCKECKRKFKNAYRLSVHKLTHWKRTAFTCEECGKQFARGCSLQIHQIMEKGAKRHLCQICGKRFMYSCSLEAHVITDHHLSRRWCCTNCGESFRSKSNLRGHLCAVKDEGTAVGQPAKCEICNVVFSTGALLKGHLKKHRTPDKAHACSQCPRKFATQQGLQQHESAHRGGRPYQCGICFVGFIRKTSLTKHYKTHAAEKAVSCRVCRATFPTVGGLLNHGKSHTPQQWSCVKKGCCSPEEQRGAGAPDGYQCAVCSKFLSNKLSLSLHMRTHTGVKPYQCEECKKRFTQKPALTYHQRLHTGERPHVCQYCQKGFNSKVGKESHERIHTGERPYKCGQCGVGFRCSANLRQHTWIHSDRRPFTCEVCKKLFRRREALQVHMRIHTGERPYACPICSRRFTQKGDMMKHTRSHSKGAQGVTCHSCGEVFSKRVNFKLHESQCSQMNIQIVSKIKDSPKNTETFILRQEMKTDGKGEDLKTITIATEDVRKYSDISIVPREVIQEIEVEYETK